MMQSSSPPLCWCVVGAVCMAAVTGCQMRLHYHAPLWLLLLSGCSAPVNIEPLAPMMRQLAEVTMALSAAAISMETNQSAGRDLIVNDPWLARAGLAAATIVFYMTFVRPIRGLIVRTIKGK